MPTIRGVVFDKDGTLFDFNASWVGWARSFLHDLAGGHGPRIAFLGEAIGFDVARGVFAPDSPVIAATPGDIAEALLPHLPDAAPEALVARMNDAAAGATMAEAVPLGPLMAGFRARGLRLAVATNDGEAPARAHLAAAGVLEAFDFVAGFDSGFGPKPEPGMLVAFARAFGLAPAEVLMVGDSRHDLEAAHAAGMRPVGVLTGPAREADLAPLAEVVLPDIGHLPAWIERRIAAESAA